MPRTRLTGFSRLLIFLLIALPILYFAAAYYNGEDPVKQVKDLVGMNDTETTIDQTAPATEELRDLRLENEQLREELARCRDTTQG